jgi:hypothetical protein
MTEAIRAVVQEMTGVEPVSCPWRAFSLPLVTDVLKAFQFFESGNLGVALPEPSHKLVEALGFWSQVNNRVQAKQMELERAERKQAATATQQEAQVRRR